MTDHGSDALFHKVHWKLGLYPDSDRVQVFSTARNWRLLDATFGRNATCRNLKAWQSQTRDAGGLGTFSDS